MPHNLKTFKTMENFKEIWPDVAWSEMSGNSRVVVFTRTNQKKQGLNSGTKYLKVWQGI